MLLTSVCLFIRQNKFLKIIDDMYIILPGGFKGTRDDEIFNISEWASRNNLMLNISNIVEIFSKPRSRTTITSPDQLPGIHCSKSLKIFIKNN